MDILITYDLAPDFWGVNKNTDVKNEMKSLGYMESFKSDGTTYTLPNTTLWKGNTTSKQGKNDLIKCANKFNVKPERLIALEFTDIWAAIPGEPYK